MNNEIYLNCGIYQHGTDDPLLFIAVPGYFASSAWCQSDELYNSVSGRKFEGITSDDCSSWQLDRSDIRRISESDDIAAMLDKACPEFKQMFVQKFSKIQTSEEDILI